MGVQSAAGPVPKRLIRFEADQGFQANQAPSTLTVRVPVGAAAVSTVSDDPLLTKGPVRIWPRLMKPRTSACFTLRPLLGQVCAAPRGAERVTPG